MFVRATAFPQRRVAASKDVAKTPMQHSQIPRCSIRSLSRRPDCSCVRAAPHPRPLGPPAAARTVRAAPHPSFLSSLNFNQFPLIMSFRASLFVSQGTIDFSRRLDEDERRRVSDVFFQSILLHARSLPSVAGLSTPRGVGITVINLIVERLIRRRAQRPAVSVTHCARPTPYETAWR